MEYYAQEYNDKGKNWIDRLGCNDLYQAAHYANAEAKNNKTLWRVIKREDKHVFSFAYLEL